MVDKITLDSLGSAVAKAAGPLGLAQKYGPDIVNAFNEGLRPLFEEAGKLQHYGDAYYDAGPATQAALGTIGAPAAAGGVPLGALGSGVGKGIRAYHGSPHDFERFDLSKIGTGEGAQAYGHGLYFAENPAVAKEYRDVLTRRPVNDAGIDPAVAGGAVFDIAAKSGDLISGKIPFGPTRSLLTRDELVSGFQQGKYSPFDLSPAMQRQIVDHIKPPGKMYEVNINADPAQFLQWDKPLAEQPAAHEALINAARNPAAERLREQQWRQPAWVGGAPNETTYPQAIAAGTKYMALGADVGSPARLSAALQEQGIPGIKYLDQGSRFNQALFNDNPIANEARKFIEAAGGNSQKAGELFHQSNPVERWAAPERDQVHQLIQQGGNKPTSNYVLFRDDIIDILRKYGLAATAAPPAIGAATTSSQQQQ
jgi:hypothetical protein